MNPELQPPDEEFIGPPPLRFQFVGMLFALAIAEVAVKWADVVAKVGLTYNSIPSHLHLSLAVFVTANSWIGWSRSRAPGNLQSIKHPFSVEYLILLVDVALVVLYFMIARSVDSSGEGAFVASAREEFVLISIVFGLYLLWDFLTNQQFSRSPADEEVHSEFWLQGRISGACLVVSLGGLCLLSGVRGTLSVSIADVGLIALVFFFRAWKEKIGLASALSGLIALGAFLGAWLIDRAGY